MNLLIGALLVLLTFTLIWGLRQHSQLRAQRRRAAAEAPRLARAERILADARGLGASIAAVSRDLSVERDSCGAAFSVAEVLAGAPEGDRDRVREAVTAVYDDRQRREVRFNSLDRAWVAEICAARDSTSEESLVLLYQACGEAATSDPLRHLAARNDAVLRTAMDGFFVVAEDFRFLEVNAAFARMTGYSEAELLCMTILDLEADEPDRSAHSAAYARTGMHQFPTAHRHRDGHLIYLEISISVLRDGKRKLTVGFARDVTERRRSEETLLQMSRQKKLILNSVGEGIIGVDNSGAATFANPAAARLLGRNPAEIVGKQVHEVLHSGASTTACAVCSAILHGDVRRSTEGVFSRADGQAFPVEFSSTPIHEGGKLSGAVVVFADIAARKRAEEERRRLESQIAQAQRMESLGLLAGGIAHDFNNILVGILGNACLAMDELPANSAVRPRLQRVVNAGHRASKIIHQILAYSGQARPDPAPLDLNQVVGETVEFLRATIPSGVVLETRFDERLPRIHADAGQFEQVITNLLMNAVEAIGMNSGCVVLTSSRVELSEQDAERNFAGQGAAAGEYACLSVCDNGCGMTAEVMARIFDPFFSAKKAPGRGLGLAAIRGIIRAHGGLIQAHSEPGRGTTFRVLWPFAEAPALAPASVVRLVREPRDATVLVIDDEEDIRDVVQSVLESRGVRVFTAEDGPSGIELFRAHLSEIDVVLLDVSMPGMNGPDVLRELRAIRPGVRAILSSGYSETDVSTRVDASDHSWFIHKPYTIDALIERISGAMRATPAMSV